MKPLFDYTDYDRQVYETELRDFLPPRLIDMHTHIWKREFTIPDPSTVSRGVSWPLRVALDNPIEDLQETYRILFPRQTVLPLVFGYPEKNYDLQKSNAYAAEVTKKTGIPALMLATPDMGAAELENAMERGGFRGIKVYFNYAPEYIPENEIRIYDFLPPHQLQWLHETRRMVVLHIPRPARLKDPVNLAQMLEIDRNYPDATVIIAHVGRAYSEEDVGDAFSILAQTRHLLFDFSANTNSTVFEGALRTFGTERILFGSDLPILRMRMRRITENGRYINIVPRGLYGDVSGDPHMRETDSEPLTFFMYEEIRAIRRAANRLSLSRSDIQSIFFDNAARLLRIS